MQTPVNQSVPNSNQPLPQQPMVVSPVPPAQTKKPVWIIGIILLFIILGAASGYYFLAPKSESSEKIAQTVIPQSKQESPIEDVMPTPMPFADMTIPYLREQTYTSQLSELETAFDGSNYTAYTTSYTSDGLKINGLLTRPNGESPSGGWPAIVFVHGYIPPASYETQGQAYSSYVDYLASNGFVVFKIDLRGHGQSEGEPGGAYYASDYIIDVMNAYSALENASFVNPKTIGLWGHSMAGNVLMRTWAAKKQIPAVVIWAGAVYTYEDMLQYRITDASYQPAANSTERMRRRQQIYEKYGSPSAKVKFWQEVAPVSYLTELKGAIQIHHAVDDDVVNIGYSRNLNTLLEKTSVPHEFYEYTSGGHNISGASYTEAMQRTVEFYTTHLK
jgi:dipeptidyl aminopeptidase/acylaminoacyl peptidase